MDLIALSHINTLTNYAGVHSPKQSLTQCQQNSQSSKTVFLAAVVNAGKGTVDETLLCTFVKRVKWPTTFLESNQVI